jgi:hypothetical protein
MGVVTVRGDLLAGPRGRQVCCELLEAIPATWRQGVSGLPRGSADELRGFVGRCDLDWLVEAAPAVTFFGALFQTVEAAVYWEEPDWEDRWLADPGIGAALRPVARAVARAPGARWWASPMDPEQHEVVFDDLFDDDPIPDVPPLPSGDAHAALVRWRADTVEDEQRWRRGPWWSTPAPSGLISTTRALPGGAPVGLSLVEDGMGWTAARCQPRRPRPGASVFEIGGPEDWAELVRRYPLAVTRSRRHEWCQVTGQAVEWAIPDYLAASRDYDGIHLTVQGYLSTAGRALALGDASTVLAGWDPDRTWWLTDATEPAGPSTRWTTTDSHGCGWTPTMD